LSPSKGQNQRADLLNQVRPSTFSIQGQDVTERHTAGFEAWRSLHGEAQVPPPPRRLRDFSTAWIIVIGLMLSASWALSQALVYGWFR